MKWKDFLIKSISKYPGLYHVNGNPELSEANVAHQAFIVLGNGLEWAKSERGFEGYLCHPNVEYNEDTDEYKHLHSEKYGDVKATNIEVDRYNRMMGGEIAYYCVLTKPTKDDSYMFRSEREIMLYNDIPKDLLEKEWFVNGMRDASGWRAIGEAEFSIYPNFEKTYSPFWEDGFDSIQDDWAEAAIRHLLFCKKFVTDEKNIPLLSWYPGSKDAEDLINTINAVAKNGEDPVSKIYKDYGGNGSEKNAEEVVMNRWSTSYNTMLSFIDETVDKLNGKLKGGYGGTSVRANKEAKQSS